MKSITASYERAMRSWGPWQKFRKIVECFGMNEKSIAYTNIAKCWQTLRLTIGPDSRKPMRACVSAFPIFDLAKEIRANAVIVMSADSSLAYAGILEDGVPMFSFPGRPKDSQLHDIATQIGRRFLQ